MTANALLTEDDIFSVHLIIVAILLVYSFVWLSIPQKM